MANNLKSIFGSWTFSIALGVLCTFSPSIHAQTELPPSPTISIDSLEAPTPAEPPKVDHEKVMEDDYKRLQRRRRRHEKEEVKASPTYGDRLGKALDDEAAKPHPRDFFLEISLVGSAVATMASRQGYTSEPTMHFSSAWRLPQKADIATGTTPSPGKNNDLWFGLRVAPFNGSGFYRGHTGSYGLTYFGPMIAVGKIDPPTNGGSSEAGTASAQMAKIERPVLTGWLISGGVAAVSKQGRSDAPGDAKSDFLVKGVGFDAPGVWIEFRQMSVLYGALGCNLLAGFQTGQDKAFFYGGIGFAGWD